MPRKTTKDERTTRQGEADQFEPHVRETKPKSGSDDPNDIDVRMRNLLNDHIAMGARPAHQADTKE